MLLFVIGALIFFQKYIFRGIAGHWRSVGDAFGSGRQYDPKQTIECKFDPQFFNVWYDSKCADNFNCISLSNVGCIKSSISGCRRSECDN